MNTYPQILAIENELKAWRHDLHAHPELAFEEARTAAFVAERLTAFGLDVTIGVGGTGVVATLRAGSNLNAIGLRADMDALAMTELNEFAHRSKYPGRMHGCGHDGHTVMLLGAARHLAETRNFDGVVHFIFQPAEEANHQGSGALAMIQDGLFERFPMDAVFGMHNYKAAGLATGGISARPGPMLAAMDLFEVVITGKGGHGALPHIAIDPVLVCAQLTCALQSIVSRNVDPLQSAVLSVTTIQAGDSWNVIPQTATIRGSIRTLSPELRSTIEERFKVLTEHLVAGFGAHAEITYRREIPVLANDPAEVEWAAAAARDIVGEEHVLRNTSPTMGSEDFAWFLMDRPGAYVLIGNGDGPQACTVHEPYYDFNDDILAIGTSFWARLVETRLARKQA